MSLWMDMVLINFAYSDAVAYSFGENPGATVP